MYIPNGDVVLIVASLIASITNPEIPDPPPPPPIEVAGVYLVNMTVEGEEIVGVCRIEKQKENLYRMVWAFPDNGPSIGQGMRDGNRFWVAWGRGQSLGIARYRIEFERDQPKLIEETGTKEILTFLRPIAKP